MWVCSCVYEWVKKATWFICLSFKRLLFRSIYMYNVVYWRCFLREKHFRVFLHIFRLYSSLFTCSTLFVLLFLMVQTIKKTVNKTSDAKWKCDRNLSKWKSKQVSPWICATSFRISPINLHSRTKSSDKNNNNNSGRGSRSSNNGINAYTNGYYEFKSVEL